MGGRGRDGGFMGGGLSDMFRMIPWYEIEECRLGLLRDQQSRVRQSKTCSGEMSICL